MTALTVPNTLPETIVALSSEATGKIFRATCAISTAEVVDVPTSIIADAAHKAGFRLLAEIDKNRLECKRPIAALGEQLDAAAAQGTAELRTQLELLGQRLIKFEKEENERRMAAHRAREAEARRLQAIEDARAEEARKAALLEAELSAPLGEAPALDDVTVELPRMVDPPPPPEVFKSKAVRANITTRLHIDDASKIPHDINGAPLWVPDEKTIKKLMDAGVQVPGCTLVRVESVASKAMR